MRKPNDPLEEQNEGSEISVEFEERTDVFARGLIHHSVGKIPFTANCDDTYFWCVEIDLSYWQKFGYAQMSEFEELVREQLE